MSDISIKLRNVNNNIILYSYLYLNQYYTILIIYKIIVIHILYSYKIDNYPIIEKY